LGEKKQSAVEAIFAIDCIIIIIIMSP